jgi:hypothetical protein
VLVVVDQVLLKTEEVDDVDAIDEAEDAELELLMLEALKLGLLLLEDDGLLLLAEELVLDVRDVLAWLTLFDAEEDVDENAELKLEADGLNRLEKVDETAELDELDEMDKLEVADVL